MQDYLILVLGILITILGVKSFGYFNKNQDSINYQIGKLYNLSIVITAIGVILTVIPLIEIINNLEL